MKIAIINITGGGMCGGYRKYLLNMIPRMANHHDVDSLLCVAPFSLNVQDWFTPLSKVRYANCSPYRFLNYSQNDELKKIIEGFSPNVIFVPVERPFQFSNIPVVRMLQNMGPFAKGIKGNPVREKIKLWLQAIDAKRAIMESDRIIATSNYVRKYIIQEWKIPEDKVGLVYFGADVKEQNNNNNKRPAGIQREWHNRFLFTAGSIDPYRALEDIIDAMRILMSCGVELKLVIAGKERPVMLPYKKKLMNFIQCHNLTTRVNFIGQLDEKEMSWCYQNCYAFVMTSRVEACPNIALEAMANGCICVSTTSPPMPEIFSEAAIYYKPEDPKSLSEAVSSILCLDNDKRKELSEKAKNRARDFSWDKCAEKTVDELKKAVAAGIRIKD